MHWTQFIEAFALPRVRPHQVHWNANGPTTVRLHYLLLLPSLALEPLGDEGGVHLLQVAERQHDTTKTGPSSGLLGWRHRIIKHMCTTE